jgi:hypothetical protein
LAEAITFIWGGLGVSASENIVITESLNPIIGTVQITASELLAFAEMLACSPAFYDIYVSVVESLSFTENVINFQDAWALIKFLMKTYEVFDLKTLKSFALKKKKDFRLN